MIALRLVRLIEHHSDELTAELVVKLKTSSRTADLRKVPRPATTSSSVMLRSVSVAPHRGWLFPISAGRLS